MAAPLSRSARQFLCVNQARLATLQPVSSRVAAPRFARIATPFLNRSQFHTTPSRQLLPPLPQKVLGTLNDAATVPDPAPAHGSYHWTFERLISAALIPLTIAPFAGGSLNPTIDALLVTGLIAHTHIGFQSVIIDYLPSKRVPKARKLFSWGLNLATVVVGIGFYEFETNDVGVTEAIKRIWKA